MEFDLLAEMKKEGKVICRENCKDFHILKELANDGFVTYTNVGSLYTFNITAKGTELIGDLIVQ